MSGNELRNPTGVKSLRACATRQIRCNLSMKYHRALSARKRLEKSTQSVKTSKAITPSPNGYHIGLRPLTFKPVDLATDFQTSATCSVMSTKVPALDPCPYSAANCRNNSVSGNCDLACVKEANRLKAGRAKTTSQRKSDRPIRASMPHHPTLPGIPEKCRRSRNQSSE